MRRTRLFLLLLVLLLPGCLPEEGGTDSSDFLQVEALHRAETSAKAAGNWVFTAEDGSVYNVTLVNKGNVFEWWEDGQKLCDLTVQGQVGSEFLADFQLRYVENGVQVEEWWMIQLWLDGATYNLVGDISLVITHDGAIWRTGYDRIHGVRG